MDFPELHTSSTDDTVDGTATIETTAGTLYIDEIYDGDNEVYLKWIPWSKYISYTDRNTSSAEGIPKEWHRRGTVASNDIYLHSTPDDAYTLTIYYRKKPSLLTGTNTTAIGDEWDYPIVQLATVFGLQWLQEYEKANVVYQAWLQNVMGLAGIYMKEELARRENIQPSSLWLQGKDMYR